jgi:hypothetical protein
MTRVAALILFILISVGSSAQQLNIPYSPIFEQQYLAKIYADRKAFTSLKPILDSRVDSLDYDKVALYKQSAPRKNWFLRKFTNEPLIVVDTGDFRFSIDPLLNVSAGKGYLNDNGGKLYTNSRGIIARGDITERFSFETSFLESQSFFPKYLSSYVKANNVVPGMARAKAFKVSGYDYAFGSGYISWSPSNLFNLQLGHGHHFIGEGYRSMLLSDNTFNYPYIKPSFQYKWIKYDVIYSSLMIMHAGQIRTTRFNEPIFRKKPGTFHLLTVKPVPMLELGLFEGTIFHAETPGKPESFDFVNPIIGVNTLRFGLDDKDNNVVAGILMSVKPIKEICVYGQLVGDDQVGAHEKAAYQGGLRIVLKQFQFQAEYNKANPYSYSATNTFQAYSHYNQSLSHPWGASFEEFNGSVSTIFFSRLIIAARGSMGKTQSLGMNILMSDSITTLSAKIPSSSDLLFVTGLVQYIINPSSNLSVFAETTYRKKTFEGSKKEEETGFIYFGIKTDLFTSYRDF